MEHIVERLLATEDRAVQQVVLADNDLWHVDGMLSVLVQAQQRLQTDASSAEKLLVMLAELGKLAAFPSVTATANWQLARHAAQHTNFEQALTLLDQAAEKFTEASQPLQATRTAIGRIMVLTELGRASEIPALAEQALAEVTQHEGEGARQIEAQLLHNRGIAHSHAGNFHAALADYARAEKLYMQLGADAPRSELIKSRGVEQLALGQPDEALASFQTAARLLQQTDQPIQIGQALNNVGYAQLLMGQYDEGRRNLTAAVAQLDNAGYAGFSAVPLLDLADLNLTVGLVSEAIQQYQQAIAQFQQANMQSRLVHAQRGLGVALFADGQDEQALTMLQQTLQLAEQLDNTALRSSTMLDVIAVLISKGRYAGARLLAVEALALAQAEALPIQEAQAAMQLFDLALENGELEQAETYLNMAEAVGLTMPHIVYRLALRKGRLQYAERELTQAEDHFRAAITLVEQLRGRLKQESLRIAFMGDKLEAHEALIDLLLEQGVVREAFAVAERAKSRALVDHMGTLLDDPPDGTQFDSAEKIARMRQMLNALYNQLLDDGGEQRGALAASETAAVHERAVQLEQEIRQLQLTTGPSSTALFPTGTQPKMPEQLLIAYHALGDELLAFVHVEGQLHVQRRLCSVQTVRSLLAKWQVQLRRMRTGGEFVKRNLSKLTVAAERVLHALYVAVFEPLEPLLPTSVTAQPLIVIPHGELHHLPIHALHDGNDYLLERFLFSFAPSLTVLQAAKQRAELAPQSKQPQTALFGVSDPSLHGVIAETDAIAQLYKDERANLFVDEAATYQAFQTQTSADIMHIATHGIHRAEHPSFSGFKLHDRWVSADDILSMRFRQSLVVVSACESGRSQVQRGDEPLGLTRAFLAAGASNVLVSLWLVQDGVSAEMMPMFYQQLQSGVSQAAALRTAQLASKQAHGHPYYWAAFVLIGCS